MDLIIIFLGIACLSWTTRELLQLGRRPVAQFGAVDLDSGRPLDVVFDRRTPRSDRRTEPDSFRARA